MIAMNPPRTLLIVSLVFVLLPCSIAAEEKIQEFRSHDDSGTLMEVIRYYVAANGTMIRHGVSIEYRSYATMEVTYKDGKPISENLRAHVSAHRREEDSRKK
jgi:hypothetical protein